MSRFSIGTRIVLGFCVVLALLGAVALMGVSGNSEAHHTFREYARIVDNTLVIRTIDRNVAGLRRNALTYATNGDENALARIGELRTALAEDLEAVLSRVRTPEVHERLVQMKALVESYFGDFNQVQALRVERDQAVAQTDSVGPRMTNALGALVDQCIASEDYETLNRLMPLYRQTVVVRTSLLQFQGRQDPHAAKVARETSQALVLGFQEAARLEVHPDHAAALGEIVQAMLAYQDALGRQIEAIQAYSRLVTEAMPAKAAQFGDLTRDASDRQASALATLLHQTGADLDRMGSFLIGLAAGAFFIGLLAALVIARGITRPILAMTDAMGRLASGDKTILIPGQGNKDEIGAMAKAVQVFKENALRVEQLQRDQEEQRRRAESERKAALLQMAATFEASVGQVVQTVTSAATQLQAASAQMAATARQTSAQATTVAAAAEQASNNVNTVAAAAEELASSEAEIAQHIQRSAVVADQAADQAQTTHTTVTQMVEAVGKIGEIVTLINDIASQTNLLALNATIEAARAGDAGKGFAVVASEVKTLATQTARATGDIESQINRVQAVTHEAARAIETVIDTITEIDRISGSIASAVEEQTAATSEIARNVDQASRGTGEVTQNIQSVREAASETGHAAEEIANAAADLSHQAEMLREEVGKFLHQVRLDDHERTLFTWDPALDSGIPEIDRHHHAMVDEVNAFYRDLTSGKGTVRLPAMISTVTASFANHFQDEERLMQRHAYPATAEHQEAHRQTLAAVTAFAERHRAGEDIGLEFFRFLAQWLQEHLSSHDARLVHFLRQRGRLA